MNNWGEGIIVALVIFGFVGFILFAYFNGKKNSEKK
jgi:hypothetical protein